MDLSILYQVLCSALPLSIILMMISSWIRKAFKFKLSLKWISWALLLNWLVAGVILFLREDLYWVFQRTTGPYYVAYLIILVLGFGLPPLLFFKRCRSSKLFILIVSIFTNPFRKMAIFTMVLTSIHSDHQVNRIIESQILKVVLPGALLFITLYMLERIYGENKMSDHEDILD